MILRDTPAAGLPAGGGEACDREGKELRPCLRARPQAGQLAWVGLLKPVQNPVQKPGCHLLAKVVHSRAEVAAC